MTKELTFSQLQIARLAADGKNASQIAEVLHLDVDAVKRHLRAIYSHFCIKGNNLLVKLQGAIDEQ